MPTESRIRPILLSAAVSLFGTYGFEGVTTRDLAKEAGVMEAGIYRLFGGKKGIYEEALHSVVSTSLSAMTDLVFTLYTDQTQRGIAAVATKALHVWYDSLPRNGAKLLQQALLGDKKRLGDAKAPLEKIVTLLVTALEREIGKDGKKAGKPQVDYKTRSEAIIYTLFHLKTTYSGTSEGERKEMDRFIEDWLQTLPPS